MPEKETAMTQMQLTKRIDELERELNAVKREVAALKGKPLSSSDFVGMFHGDKYFERAMELGAAYRRSLNPYRRHNKALKTTGYNKETIGARL
jgi:hypothetical protein